MLPVSSLVNIKYYKLNVSAWEISEMKSIAREHYNLATTQNKEGILPVATLSIALYVLRRPMSASDVALEVAILSSAL